MSSSTTYANEADDSPWWSNPTLMLAGAVILGHAPLAALHLRSLWQREQYQYFPFVIAAIAMLLWTRWQEAPKLAQTTGRWAWLPLPIAFVALALLVCSILTVSPWLAFVSLNIGLAAVFVLLGRQRAIAYLWGIWLLLWLLVPLPLNVDERLVRMLQRLSSQLSSAILDLFGILHLMSGNVLRLPSKEFFVDEACSGIISVMSMIACATIFAVWKNRSVSHLVALILMGITWALVLNVLRICLIAGAFHFFDIDLSTGAVHEALGLALFLLMFLALVSTDHLLTILLAPIDTAHLGEAGQNNFLVRLWNRSRKTDEHADSYAVADDELGSPRKRLGTATLLACASPFLLLGVIQLVWMPSSDTPEAALALQQALDLDEEALPQKVGPWIRDSFETVEREARSEFGRYSRTYRYRHTQREGVTATVSLDFPYLGGWHDLCVCYRNSGWTINDRVVQSSDGSDQQPDWDFVAGNLEDSALGKAYVSFAGFDASGDKAEPAGDSVLFRPWFRLRRRLLLNIAPQLFQVQVFASLNSADDRELQEQLEDLLLVARTEFRERVAVTKTN